MSDNPPTTEPFEIRKEGLAQERTGKQKLDQLTRAALCAVDEAVNPARVGSARAGSRAKFKRLGLSNDLGRNKENQLLG